MVNAILAMPVHLVGLDSVSVKYVQKDTFHLKANRLAPSALKVRTVMKIDQNVFHVLLEVSVLLEVLLVILVTMVIYLPKANLHAVGVLKEPIALMIKVHVSHVHLVITALPVVVNVIHVH